MVKSNKNYRQASLDKQYRHQIILFLRIIPFYILTIIGLLGYIFLMIGLIDQIQIKQVQLQSSLEVQNQQNMLVTEIIEIVLENSTTTVRNNPIVEDFLFNLAQTQKIESLMNKFRTGDQTLEPAHQEIFYGFPCEYFAGETDLTEMETYPSCKTLAKGKDSIGLAEVNSQLYISCSQLYDLYLSSPKSPANLAQIFYIGVFTLRHLVNTSRGLLQVLHETTNEIFQDKVAQIKSESVWFSILAIVLIILFSFYVWCRIIRKIILYEAKDREILQVVPIKLILGNRYLRQHLLQDAGGMLDSIKRFL